MPDPPNCPTHKVKLRQLSSLLTTEEVRLVEGKFTVLECEVPGCPVMYSLEIAPDLDGFFKRGADGKPVPLS